MKWPFSRRPPTTPPLDMRVAGPLTQVNHGGGKMVTYCDSPSVSGFTWEWPVWPADSDGVSDDQLAGLSSDEVDRWGALVAMAMAQGFPRGYSERQAYALVRETRDSVGGARPGDGVG